MGQVGAHLRLAIHAERTLDWAWEDEENIPEAMSVLVVRLRGEHKRGE